jgi:dihydrofolate reductase
MIAIIAAMTIDGIIGKGNQLPWNIPDELKHFKSSTQGSTVIMGKKTFESIGRPLPKRNNIVLSPPGLTIPDVTVCHSVEHALQVAESYDNNIFVIGGAYTYEQFLPLVDFLYISYIKKHYDGDVFFPVVDFSDWQVVEKKDHAEFEFVLYKRRP